MARTLIIGGTSLIGRPLVRTLLEGGHEVTILHRSAATPFGARVPEPKRLLELSTRLREHARSAGFSRSARA